MHVIELADGHDFAAFRNAARGLLARRLAPGAVDWAVGASLLPAGPAEPAGSRGTVTVPPAYLELAEAVICHRDPERHALLYRALWRLAEGERSLLQVASDPLVHRLNRLARQVERDAYRMQAYVRFRQVDTAEGEHFVAWHEPEHRVLARVAPFFVERFASLRWSILTPAASLHWNGTLAHGPGASLADAPAEDRVEETWRRYYGAIFNPARLKPDAMRSQMPKKLWRNLPEAAAIPGLMSSAAARAGAMIVQPPSAPNPRLAGLGPDRPVPPAHDDTPDGLRAGLHGCRRCPLWQPATQAVCGEGPAQAALMFVGEQPGDQEDLAGRPFVGPAGRLFDRALADAGIDRTAAYVTNAVKHFKFEPRGRRRLHRSPSGGEIDACRWWLDKEIAAVRPRLVVALGGSAARGVAGRAVTVGDLRGRVLPLRPGLAGLVTVHPSYMLRLPDEVARAREYQAFVQDLRTVAATLAATA